MLWKKFYLSLNHYDSVIDGCKQIIISRDIVSNKKYCLRNNFYFGFSYNFRILTETLYTGSFNIQLCEYSYWFIREDICDEIFAEVYRRPSELFSDSLRQIELLVE